MDAESGPIRCDSSLSVVKIQPVGDGQKGKRLLAKHKFSDPEIEELYQLHSANRKRTELFRCFLYCILFYSIVHIVVYAAWIGRHPVVFGGSDNHERYSHHHESGENHGIPTTTYFDVETPETMTLNTYASMLETSNSRLLKSVFHVDDTSDILQYSVVKNHEQPNQYPAGSTNTSGKKKMSLETNSHLAKVPARPKHRQQGTPTTPRVMTNHAPLPLQAPPAKPSASAHNLGESMINTNTSHNNQYGERKGKLGKGSPSPIITSATSPTEESRRGGNAIHLLPPAHKVVQQPPSSSSFNRHPGIDEHLLARKQRDKMQSQRREHIDERNGKKKKSTGANLGETDDDDDVEDQDGSENEDDADDDTTSISQNDKKPTSRSGSTIALSRLPLHFNPSGSDQRNDAKSLAWFPYANVRTNFHFRGKRNTKSGGLPRYGESSNNQHHPKLEPVPSSSLSSGPMSTQNDGDGPDNNDGGESRESRNFKAYAYTRMESEFDSYPAEPSRGNLYFVLVVLCLLIACAFIATFMLLPFRRCPRNHHIPVIIWSATILCSVACNVESSVHPRLAFGWILMETFLIWITLPLRMRTALFYTTLLATLYVIVTSVRERNRYILRQIGADIILIVITNILGMLEFYLSDKKQRRAFIDTRQSLEMKIVIEEQAKEQEALLLSVLPEHLALKMRQDLGEATDGQQFKKIYMSRHENVSILYADIVGFTAISSTYSASELVKILNELFATFDKLAEKYNQIRIKILGDCYYCICGAPEEREDHALLCVYMGLSMVKAIKYVREKTKSAVDMRVGIHTGAILAGLIGQRQWQYDIYSKDVELANKMESSGLPGRVHISEVTLSFLNEGFEVEPAHGEKREESLRIAGIKTYFIVRPIKPFRESCTGATENGDLPPDDTLITKDLPSDLHSTFAEDSNSAIDESHVHGKQTEIEAYRLRLKEELISRDGYKDLSRQSQWLTLSFRDSTKETEFTKHKDPYAGIYYGACPIALVAVALSAFAVISFTIVGLVVLLVGLLFLALITTFSACETSPMKSRLKKMSGIIESFCSLESELWVRRLVSVLGAFVLTGANVAFLIPCFETKECSTHITDEVEEPLVLPNLASKISGQRDDCRLPAFFIPFATVILFSITLLTYLGFWLKSLIIFGILLLHTVLMLATPLKAGMECTERLHDNDQYRLIPVFCYLALFAAVAFAGLFSLNRRLEKSARVLFLWKTEVEQQRETATQLRQKNEALVYNILPPHVATHFLGTRRRKHEELYSQSYSEVGVLFASIPNFSDFYTEETVNNQGLECLRFLNEIISDYDALLELPKFNEHIIKIKTISSTYMAASGLSPSFQAKPEDPFKTRWHHLSLLVEFAFELQKALTMINEQSFNHFVIKMGINHGPITAGVIGARKPHYDIWGNAVNVSSRMQTTSGKTSVIQVTAETQRILRLYGYEFEQRGFVNVKGKGQLMTYYLTGRGPEPSEQEVQKMLSEPETDGNTVTQ